MKNLNLVVQSRILCLPVCFRMIQNGSLLHDEFHPSTNSTNLFTPLPESRHKSIRKTFTEDETVQPRPTFWVLPI